MASDQQPKFGPEKFWTYHVQAFLPVKKEWAASCFGSDDLAEARALQSQVMTEDSIWQIKDAPRKTRVAERIATNHYVPVDGTERTYAPNKIRVEDN